MTHPSNLPHFFAANISDALRTQSCCSCKLQAVSKIEIGKFWGFSWQFQGFVKSLFLSKSNPRRFESAWSREIWSTSGSSEFRAGRSEEAAARRDGLRYVSGSPGEWHHGYLWISPWISTWISTWISMDIYYLQPWISMMLLRKKKQGIHRRTRQRLGGGSWWTWMSSGFIPCSSRWVVLGFWKVLKSEFLNW